MQKLIDNFLKLFPEITKEEADYIENVLKWDEEKKAAFFFAKRIFEENMNEVAKDN